AAGPVAPENPMAIRGEPRQDTRLADSLLDAAGWPRSGGDTRSRGGQPLDFELLTVGSSDNAIEQLIQSDLAARGIRMRIRQVEGGAFLTNARAADKRFDALIAGVPGDLSLSYVSAMFESAQGGGSLDYAAFHRPILDAAFEKTRSASSDAARTQAWREVQQVLRDSVPVSWIYHSRGIQGISARLLGVTMDLRGELVSIARWSAAGPPGARAR
ncbi:MAG TPA: ABC transporter substrate-binding protein, partial [Gemmatimonadaceae bacterium]